MKKRKKERKEGRKDERRVERGKGEYKKSRGNLNRFVSRKQRSYN